MSPVGFETTIPASARLQTYALDRAATGIGSSSSSSSSSSKADIYKYKWRMFVDSLDC
jgi:hypothetical protein